MNIFNIRLGHACNSSSAHSLLLAPGKDYKDNFDAGDYGWNWFVCGTETAKKDYLATTLLENIKYVLSSEIADAVIAQWVGSPVTKEHYIDHQSRYTLPRAWKQGYYEQKTFGLDKEFFDDFKAYLLQQNLFILGGNDNDSEPEFPTDEHTVTGQRINLPVPQDSYGTWVARKDKAGNYWSIFNRETGAKIRFSFDDLTMKPVKAFAPELVDLKITDYCPFGCAYCYQGSTGLGQHGEYFGIRSIIKALGELKVFEVALGGGEPTMHPDFDDILDALSMAGINANFTTKSTEWMEDPVMIQAVLNNASSFAMSISSPAHLASFLKHCDKHGLNPEKYSIQLVMGTHHLEEFQEILDMAGKDHLRITLLGYKPVNRGAQFPMITYDKAYFDAVLLKLQEYQPISVDTVLAKQWEPWLKAHKVNRLLYTTTEGDFSCYIDAVTMTMGPSSYCDPTLMIPVKAAQEKFPIYEFAPRMAGLFASLQVHP